MRVVLACLALAGVLAACATRTAAVDQRLILPEGAARYEMESNQAFVFPVPQGNATHRQVVGTDLVWRQRSPACRAGME